MERDQYGLPIAPEIPQARTVETPPASTDDIGRAVRRELERRDQAEREDTDRAIRGWLNRHPMTAEILGSFASLFRL